MEVLEQRCATDWLQTSQEKPARLAGSGQKVAKNIVVGLKKVSLAECLQILPAFKSRAHRPCRRCERPLGLRPRRSSDTRAPHRSRKLRSFHRFNQRRTQAGDSPPIRRYTGTKQHRSLRCVLALDEQLLAPDLTHCIRGFHCPSARPQTPSASSHRPPPAIERFARPAPDAVLSLPEYHERFAGASPVTLLSSACHRKPHQYFSYPRRLANSYLLSLHRRSAARIRWLSSHRRALPARIQAQSRAASCRP